MPTLRPPDISATLSLRLMKAFSKKPATYDDIVALPEGMVGQLIDGELIASPRPAFHHARVASVLGMDLGGAFDRGRGGPGGWWIVAEPELHFGKNVLVPDLAGWRRERIAALPAGPHTSIAPDWVCEVTSPSTAGIDRVRKMPIYATQGVQFVWVVDPVGRSIEVFSLDGSAWKLASSHGGDDNVRAAPFEAVELDLATIWHPDDA